MGTILACIDGSAYHASVCAYAAWAATRTSSSIEVLHVLGRRETSSIPANFSGGLGVDTKDTLLEELAELDASRAKLAQRRGRLLLDQAKAAIGPDIAIETRLRNGGLVETLLEFEPGARLVVIGKRGEASAHAADHLGSNLERVVRTSLRPVLVASRIFRPIRRLLLAFDGGPSSLRAVELAATDPLFRGLECHVLSVGPDDAAHRAPLEAAARRLRDGGLAVHAALQAGVPEEALAAYVEAHAIDCLVMGAYGHSRIRNLIIGSTTSALVRATHVPVLMVR